MTKKYDFTKKEMFTVLVDIVKQADFALNNDYENVTKEALVERLEHEIELLNKKSGSINEEKEQLNAELKAYILEALEDARETGLTVSEMQKAKPELGVEQGITASKITAMLKQLRDAGMVERKEIKRKPYYFIVDQV